MTSAGWWGWRRRICSRLLSLLELVPKYGWEEIGFIVFLKYEHVQKLPRGFVKTDP